MQRIRERDVIEARLLELAHTTDAKLTAPALAYFAPCSIEDASAVLEQLAARDQLTMDVLDDGSIVYDIRGRQRLALAAPATTTALVPSTRNASPIVAALLSLWLPGAGHLYAGRVTAAVMWFVVVGLGYALILPGLILHLFCMVSAAGTARHASAPPLRRLALA